MFAYRLVSGHWRVQIGVERTGEEGTVTTAGVLGLNVIRVWQQRKAEWVDVASLAMRVHVGRQRKGGVDVIDVEGEEDAPLTPSAWKRKAPPPPRKGTPMPPPRQPCVRPPRRSGRSQRSRRQGGGRGGRWGSGWSSSIRCSGRGRGRCATSAEAASRDLEARLSRANDDTRAAETRLAEVTKERDRLVTKVKSLKRDLGTARKAAGALAKPPPQTGEGA